jgi:hypothetical protein
MSKELGLLNFICILAVIGFLVMIVVTAVTAGDLLTTDTLFIITVCLVMAVMFAASPLLYLRSEGKLPIPFVKKPAAPIAASASGTPIVAPKAPMLDAKGRAMPADVRAIVSNLGPAEAKES